VPHTGVGTLFRLQERLAGYRLLERIFTSFPQPRQPMNPMLATRNALIQERYAEGDLMSDLSREYGISLQRISQIVHHKQ
jgi:hypothetical protein